MYHLNSIKADDLEACADLYVRVFNAEPWNDQWTLDTANNRLRDIFMTPNFVGISCIENGVLLGAAFGNCEHWYQGMHYNLREMFVAPEMQGKGIGSKLLKSMQEQIKDNNVNSIILFTSKGNETYAFYEKNGFTLLEGMAMMSKEV